LVFRWWRGPNKIRNAKSSQHRNRSVLSTYRAGKWALNHGNNDKADWIIDSGATDHYANNKEMFSEIRKLKKPLEISVANDQIEKATHIGTIKLFSDVNKSKHPITLTEVLLVEGLGLNLISVSKIESKGFSALSKNGETRIMNPYGDTIAIAPRAKDVIIRLSTFIQ
jgi:hypothetical protein